MQHIRYEYGLHRSCWILLTVHKAFNYKTTDRTEVCHLHKLIYSRLSPNTTSILISSIRHVRRVYLRSFSASWLPIPLNSDTYLGLFPRSQEREPEASGNENIVYQSEVESEVETKNPLMNGKPKGQRTLQTTRRKPQLAQQSEVEKPLFAPRDERITGNMGGRTGAIRESRIKDRLAKVGEKDSSLKNKIEVDLEFEVDLYARGKGDVTIGLI
jgi:hypothetical protein